MSEVKDEPFFATERLPTQDNSFSIVIYLFIYMCKAVIWSVHFRIDVCESYVTFAVYWIEKMDVMLCANYLQFREVCEAK